jgi:hypothetical protein
MVPSTILHQLARLRGRERVLRFTWGVARWVAVLLVVLGFACLLDWIVDRFTETPWGLRYFVAGAQLLLTCLILAVWVFAPTLRRLSDNLLALWVEDKHPRLNHRLISTVQFNQPGAKTQGMSQELIGVVTKDTEKQAARMNFAAVADHSRLPWSAGVVTPVVLLCLGLFVLMPQLVSVLLARQLLMDVNIPRLYKLRDVTAERVWPAGEDGTVMFEVEGPDLGEHRKGSVMVYPLGQGGERIDLEYYGPHEEEGKAYYKARIEARSADFGFNGYLGDGRTGVSYIRYEARPAITDEKAWVLMPFNQRGKGKGAAVYEQPQNQADIVAIALPRQKLMARVQLAASKPIKKARLELLGTKFPNMSAPFGDSETQVKNSKAAVEALRYAFLGARLPMLDEAIRGRNVLRTFDMNVKTVRFADKKNPKKIHESPGAEVEFDLRPTETAYRLTVFDERGWQNVPPKEFNIQLVPEEAPQVALLPEIIRDYTDRGNDEDFDQTGMPVFPGQPIQVAYNCVSQFSLGRATLYWRVIKKPREDGGESPVPDEKDWQRYYLEEVPAAPDRGPFALRYGAFQKSPVEENVEFHVIESSDDRPGKTEGGGRYNFQTRTLSFTSRGVQYISEALEPGDKIEFYVEVFPDGRYARNKVDVAATRLPGRSEVRIKEVVSFKDWQEALERRKQQEDRLKELRKQQEKVGPQQSLAPPPRPAEWAASLQGLRPGQDETAPPGFGRLAAFREIDAFLIARAEVGWEPSRRGSHLRHFSMGGFSC